ncbi:MAG: DNA-deoxyinosine glycosylase [Firmicutes bacterium]|nr:DNA-deoxyinosine glycosylase [Bacillota bacterium]
MKTECASFAPSIGPACRVLVLGSMPGAVSLRAARYYAHPRNAFWPVLYALWGRETPDEKYEDRLAFALSHGVALWDAARACFRDHSSDATIRAAKPNDFAALFAEYPAVHTVFCNGLTAYALFLRLAGDSAGGRPVVALPSTSPAHTLPFAQKLAAWRALRAAAEEE